MSIGGENWGFHKRRGAGKVCREWDDERFTLNVFYSRLRKVLLEGRE